MDFLSYDGAFKARPMQLGRREKRLASAYLMSVIDRTERFGVSVPCWADRNEYISVKYQAPRLLEAYAPFKIDLVVDRGGVIEIVECQYARPLVGLGQTIIKREMFRLCYGSHKELKAILVTPEKRVNNQLIRAAGEFNVRVVQILAKDENRHNDRFVRKLLEHKGM